MKRTLILTSLALLAAMPPALAWPFDKKFTGATSTYAVYPGFRCMPFRTGGGSLMQIFLGGPEVISLNPVSGGGYTTTTTQLPLPDTDPYAPGIPAVSFRNGRGDTGDIDGDGDTDIVYSCVLSYNGQAEEGNVRFVVCRNNGNGTWTRIYQMKNTNAPHHESPEIRLADFDGDGDPDIASTHEAGVRIYWNNGTGTSFTATSTPLSGGSPRFLPYLAVADFDGNGWVDLATAGAQASDGAGRLSILLNTAGTFSVSHIRTTGPNHQYLSVAAADMNGDGRPDLVTTQNGDVVQRSTWQMHLHTSTGGGTFGTPLLLHSGTARNLTQPVVYEGVPFAQPVDLDRDGLMDIFFASQLGEARWLRRTATGTYAQGPVIDATLDGQNGNAAPADVDQDGDMDIVAWGGGQIFVNQTPGLLPYASSSLYSGVDKPAGTVRLAAADVNGDGRDDLIASDSGGQRVRWYAGNGTGLNSSFPISTGGATPDGVAAGDFDRDGSTDIVWSTTAGALEMADNTNGNGITWSFSTLATLTGTTEIKAADMDADGDLDLINMIPSSGVLRYRRNDGGGSWPLQSVSAGLTGLSAFAVGEFPAGGRPEIASLSASGTGGSVRLHAFTSGAWAQSTQASPTISTASRAVVFADMDHARPGNELVFTLGMNRVFTQASGAAPVAELADTLFPVTRIAATDWNQDGHTDLLLATTGGLVLYNNFRSHTATKGVSVQLYGPRVALQDVVVLDLNGDAFPDAAAVDTTGQIHLTTNRTSLLSVDFSGRGSSAHAPGASITFASARYFNNAVDPGTVHCTPRSFEIAFRRSMLNAGTDTPGSYLTPAEATALIESIIVLDDDFVLAATLPLPGAGSSIYSFPLPESARNQLRVSNWEDSSLTLMVKLKPTAGSSAVTRFYVELLPNTTWDYAVNGGAWNALPSPFELSSGVMRTLITLTTPTALQAWRLNHFATSDNAGNAANDADPDRDGVPNLAEYFYGTNPKLGEAASNNFFGLTMFPPATRTSPVNFRLFASTVALADPKLSVRVQYATGNLNAAWSDLSTYTGGGTWTGVMPTVLPPAAGRSNVSFVTSITPLTTPKFFLRLNLEELP